MAKILKNTAVLLAIVLVFSAAILGLNHVASPIIDQNEAARATGALAVVLPGGTTFEALDLTTLSDIPATVTAIHKESADKGYVVELSTTSQYSAGPLTFLMGVDASGNIAGISITNYQESLKMKDEFPAHLVGQNSTLANVDMTLAAGTTFTATAFKNAVADAFAALSANGLVAEAKKSDAQVLKELAPSLFSGLAKYGNLDVTELAVSGNIELALKANSGVGFAYVMKNGESSVLVLVNNGLATKAYGVDGAECTIPEALVQEAVEFTKANLTQVDTAKFSSMMEGATVTAGNMDGVFSTVAGVYDITAGGKNYTGIISKLTGFDAMTVYYILDENGAIAAMDADEFIFLESDFVEYGGFAGLNRKTYKEGFVGMTEDTVADEAILIAKATMTSNAMKTATNDIFAAFKTVKGGA